MIGIGVKRTSGGGGPTFSLNSISALLQSNERFITQDDPNPITPSFTISRPDDGVSNPSMWVAPCAIVFDATPTTNSAVTEPFGECFYYWDYGDDTGEFWAYGANPGTKSKNNDIGPIGGHVYETHGTYTVTLHVMDAFGNYNTASQTITVTDPDVIFAGEDTICVSSSGDFTGKPSGALEVTSSDYSAVWSTYVGAGKRVLFRRGETFIAATTSAAKEDQSGGQIGAFGTGDKPHIDCQFESDGNVIYLWNHFTEQNNWQFYDLKITHASRATSSKAMYWRMQGSANTLRKTNNGLLTALRIDIEDLTAFFNEGDGNAIVDCSAYNPVGMIGHNNIWGAYVTLPMIAGNNIDNNNRAEHACRLQGHSRCYVAHNRFANPSGTKCTLAMRGFAINTQAGAWAANTNHGLATLKTPSTPNGYVYRVSLTGGLLDNKSGATEPAWPTTLGETVTDGGLTWMCEFVDTLQYWQLAGESNVYDNFFDVINAENATIITQISYQNTSLYEVMAYYWWHGNLYSKNGSHVEGSRFCLQINGSYCYVQNNIFAPDDDVMVGSIGVITSPPNAAGIPTSANIIIENNIFYSGYVYEGANNKDCILAHFDNDDGTDLVARNNILYVPNNNSVNCVAVKDDTGAATIENNTIFANNQVNPFVGSTFTTPDDFKLSESSYARDAGINANGVLVDFYGTTRDRTSFDMGAISKDS